MKSRELTLQATYAAERGDVERAEQLLTSAVNTSEEDADARRELGELLWREQRAVEALTMFNQAVRLAPENHVLWVRRGELQRELGMNAQARVSADRALNLMPEFAPAWLLRARVARAFGNSLEAAQYYQRALGIDPNETQALLELAEVQWSLARHGGPDAQTRLQMALAGTQLAMEVLPQESINAEHLALHGAICKDLGRYEDALDSMIAAANLAPRTPHILFQLAECQLLAGQTNAAFTTASVAAKLDPGSPLGRDLLERIRIAASPVPGPMMR